MTKEYVRQSFSRCQKYGLYKDLVYSNRIIQGHELYERLEKKKDLIEVAEPFINDLYNFLKGTSFFSILTDQDGCILRVIGDEDILEEAISLKMIPGAFMDEQNIGTNAMGTSLEEQRPVQISGTEHFIKEYYRWTCSASPIRNPEGEIIGCLDLTGTIDNVNTHTLGMVVAAVNAIEKTIRLKQNNTLLKQNNLFTEKLMNSIQAGILSCCLDGTILTANQETFKLLGEEKESLFSRSISSLIPSWGDIRTAALSGEEFQNRDLMVNTRKNKIYFNISAYPVVSEDSSISAVIIIVKDVKHVRKHANEILGRKAIYTFDKMIGRSASFTDTVDFARKVADSKSTVLISGESGTGKEIFAQSIHNCSSRKEEAFVVINCGAIPGTLIESELFGYNDGAFTGARKGGQAGKFEIADGGTLFLDEIGEMPLDMQVKLLRVIEESIVTRLGSNDPIPVDVRIIAASNKDLTREVQEGLFRSDLYYRLNVLPIKLPSLRERPEDIPLLIEYYSSKISRRLNKREVPVSDEQMARFREYSWPGNIRELENVVELMTNSEKVPPLFQEKPLFSESEKHSPARAEALEEVEKNYISQVLEENRFNIASSARQLKIGRNTLYRKIRNFGIPVPQ